MQHPSIITYEGETKGKTVTLMCGVHGNEICGPIALNKLIDEIETGKVLITNGKLHIIFANLAAMARSQRQMQMNLNRAFRPGYELTPEELQSYERQRAYEIMPYLKESDALLDIHSSSSPESTPFIICEPNSFEIAKHLPVEIVSHRWDIIEAGGTDYFMNKCGGNGICIECGYHLDPNAPAKAREGIETFLTLMGVAEFQTPPEIKEYEQRRIHAVEIYITNVNFKPAKKFADFEEIKMGQIIGHDGKHEVKAQKDCIIIFPKERKEPGKEAFILGYKTIQTIIP